jgi:SAM-dependent methyltransferase
MKVFQMADRTAGYVTDIDYVHQYTSQLNPLRIKLAFSNAGLVFPEVGTACELGFGQGLSVNFHAAASLVQWHGTDFNSSHAGFAQELSTVSGTDAKLYDEAFAEFAHRPDLPDFDFIAMHGIWSWVSDENRAILVDFIRRKLKVGGVVYVSYNAMPGWAGFAPLRHLMALHGDIIGSNGLGSVNRIKGAIGFIDKMLALDPLYARFNPKVADFVREIKKEDPVYLAHEYFNSDWHPMHFSTMSDWLTQAKLGFACSAHFPDNVDEFNLPTDARGFLAQMPVPVLRETVRDFMVNRIFRYDYWVKGMRKLSGLEQTERLRQQRIVLVRHPSDIPLKVKGTLGEGAINETHLMPILEQLVEYKSVTIGQIELAVSGKGIDFPKLVSIVMLLMGEGHLAVAQEDALAAKAREHTDKLNAFLLNRARSRSDINDLASPVTGGGVKVGAIQQLFLLAVRQGIRQPAEWAELAWSNLASRGLGLTIDNEKLDDQQQALSVLNNMAEVFAAKQLPILKALQIE